MRQFSAIQALIFHAKRQVRGCNPCFLSVSS